MATGFTPFKVNITHASPSKWAIIPYKLPNSHKTRKDFIEKTLHGAETIRTKENSSHLKNTEFGKN